jgi:hypothetical protein
LSNYDIILYALHFIPNWKTKLVYQIGFPKVLKKN